MSKIDRIPPPSDGSHRSHEVPASSKGKNSDDTLTKKAALSQVMSMVSSMVDDLKQVGKTVDSAEQQGSSSDSPSQ